MRQWRFPRQHADKTYLIWDGVGADSSPIMFCVCVLYFLFLFMHHTPCGFLVPQPGIEPTHAPCIGSTKSTTGSPGSSPQSFDFHLFFMHCSSHMQEHLIFPKTAAELFVCSQIKNFLTIPWQRQFFSGEGDACVGSVFPLGPLGGKMHFCASPRPALGPQVWAKTPRVARHAAHNRGALGCCGPAGHVRSRGPKGFHFPRVGAPMRGSYC